MSFNDAVVISVRYTNAMAVHQEMKRQLVYKENSDLDVPEIQNANYANNVTIY